MVQVQTVFLTQGWEEWAREFVATAKVFDHVVPDSEKCWVSVGERQNDPYLWVTIGREKHTRIRSGWRARSTLAEGTYQYERMWEDRHVSVDEVVGDIKYLLSAPESRALV